MKHADITIRVMTIFTYRPSL